MSILSKYISREIIKILAIVAAVVITIYLVVDFFEKIDNFMEAGLPLATTLLFFILKTPFIVVQVTPVAVLLATLVVFGLMKKNNEMIAIKSSGLGIGSLLIPAMSVGCGACLVLFIISELIVPATMSKANQIWLQQVRQKTSTLQKQDDIWIKDGQVFIHINHYDPISQTAYGLTLNYLEDGFRLVRRIDARQGTGANNRWQLQTVMDHWFDEDGGIHRADITEHLAITLSIMPDDLGRAVKKPEEMNFQELRRHIIKLTNEGYGVSKYRTDLHAKLSFPLVCLLMSVIGTGLAAAGSSRGGITATIAYGMVASFSYWIFHSFCLSLGYAGILPPAAAAWAANVLFLMAAGLLVARTGY